MFYSHLKDEFIDSKKQSILFIKNDEQMDVFFQTFLTICTIFGKLQLGKKKKKKKSSSFPLLNNRFILAVFQSL